jgi:MHS family citrate/tricarballylate:H+ symporter-like MFS transporter
MNVSSTSMSAETSASPPRPKRRHVLAAVLGHAFEYYDFLVYSFFAIQIGKTVFAPDSGQGGLTMSLAAFGVGFIARPLGAIVIGMYGDRAGRRQAMILSFALMGGSTLALAFVPSYETAGSWAAVMLFVVRCLQGFAIGGENGPTISYLVEAAPRRSRGLYCSWQLSSQGLAALVAGSIGLLLSSILDPASLQSWGWRLAFIFGAVLLPFGMYLRRSLPEPTFGHDPALDHGGTDGVEVSMAMVRKQIALGALAVASTTTRFYVLSFITTYAISTLHMNVTSAFGPSALLGAMMVALSPLNGMLGDRIGRKPVMIGASVLFMLAVVPVFQYMSTQRTLAALLIGTAILTVVYPTGNTLAVAEGLPRRLRSTSVALVYGISGVIAGSTTQSAVSWLLQTTGDPVAPAYFLVGTTLIGIIVMSMMRETAPCRIDAKLAAARVATV